jgi:L,D-peptidoglycan transpeptidase YkuD (ErfK/YbiS/YcfS/YnhG family)
MIIVKKSGLLLFNNLKFECSLGAMGIGKKIKEGDLITPAGTFTLIKLLYRSDRIENIKTVLKKKKIKKNMGWCNDPSSKNYNKLIKLPSKFSYEKLYNDNHIYDLIIPIDFNTKKIIKNKGSAIFIHIAKRKFSPTQGCIGLKKKDLIYIIEHLKKNTKIKITRN